MFAASIPCGAVGGAVVLLPLTGARVGGGYGAYGMLPSRNVEEGKWGKGSAEGGAADGVMAAQRVRSEEEGRLGEPDDLVR